MTAQETVEIDIKIKILNKALDNAARWIVLLSDSTEDYDDIIKGYRDKITQSNNELEILKESHPDCFV